MARIALARKSWLQERSEGGLQPLGDFLRFRTAAEKGLQADSVTRFEQQVEQFPAGLLRSEARGLIADAWLNHLRQPAFAEAAYRKWLLEPGLTKADRTVATTGLAHALADQHRMSEALDAMKTGGLGATPAYRQLQAGTLRRWGHVPSVVAVTLLVLIALLAFPWRTPRKALGRGWWSAFGLIVLVAVFPPVLGSFFNPAEAWMLSRCARFIGAMVLLSRLAGESLFLRRAPRPLVVTVAIVAVLACAGAGFLAVEPSDLFEELMLWRGL